MASDYQAQKSTPQLLPSPKVADIAPSSTNTFRLPDGWAAAGSSLGPRTSPRCIRLLQLAHVFQI